MTDSLEAIALRPSIIRENWLPLKIAVQEVLAFEQRFGKRHLLLACHAALPSYLTPELLNLVRLNFLDDENIASIAEADFLLSPLCRPVDERLFEVEPAVREVLLVSLKKQYGKAEGEKRLVDLAAFLRRYLAEKSHQIMRPDILNTMRWIASSYLEPDFVVQELRKQLDESLSNTENVNEALVEQAELVVLLEKIAEPLERSPMQQEYQYLMHDSHVIAQILYTDEPTDEVFATSEKDTRAGDLSNLISPSLLKWIAVSALSLVAVGSLIWLADKRKADVKNVIEPPQSVLPTTITSEAERLLSLAGWTIQDYVSADIRAERGVAIRNLPIRLDTDETQSVEYLLFVDQQAAGVVLVMEDVENRIGTEEPTSLGIRTPMFHGETSRRNPLPFNYKMNTQGVLVRFTNYLDPVSHTRSVFAFHRPETLGLWLQQAPEDVRKSQTNLLRARLRRMPPLSHEGLWNHQYEAITNLEKSLAKNHQRSLIQLPTGSGKAYMMVSSIYRLMTSGNARRILYLTNEDARAKYVYDEFQSYHIPREGLFPSPTTFPSSTTFPSGRTFPELYNVQFTSTLSAPNVSVQISPIQSLAPQLFRESTLRQYYTELSAHSEDWLDFGRKPIERIIELLTNIQDMLIDIFDGDQLENATYLTDEQQDMIRDLLSENLDLGKLTPEILADYVELIGELLLHGVSVSKRTMQYNPALPIDAFDIIIIDECTRHIIDQSQLRSVLEYFDAFLIGLTEEADSRVVNFFNNNVVYKQLPKTSLSIGISQFDICILCALAEEAEKLEEAFQNASTTLFKNQAPIVFERSYSVQLKRDYDYTIITNTIGEQLSVLVTWLPDNGPTEVGMQLHLLLQEFNPIFAAMTGICVGDREKVKLGDIIVASQAFLYDTGKMVDGKNGTTLQPNISMWSLPTSVLQAVRGFSAWKQVVMQEKRPPSLHQQRDWLLNRLLSPDTARIDDIPEVELEEHVPDLVMVIRELRKGDPDTSLTSDRKLSNPDRVRELLDESLPLSMQQQRNWLLNRLLALSTLRVDDIPELELEEHVPDLITVIQELQKGKPDAYLTSDRRLNNPERVRELLNEEVFPFKDAPQPAVYIAPMASGSAVRADNPFKEIQAHVRDTRALEMEGAAFYRTLKDFGSIQYLLVKGVSDYADKDKDDSYRAYASRISALYLLAFLREYVTSSRFPYIKLKEKAPEISLSRDPDVPSLEASQDGLNLFYSFAPEDDDMRKELEKHLVLLMAKRNGPIKRAYANNIHAGLSNNAAEFLAQSQIILLLVSPRFIANDNLYETQLKRAFELQKAGKARLIPIILRPTELRGSPLENVMVLPKLKPPISEWKSKDGAYYEVSKEIREVVEAFKKDIE